MTFISWRTIALISGTRVRLVAEHDAHVVVRPLDDAVRDVATAFFTCGEFHLRPMSRLAA